jgi:hypothetical protein
MSWEEDHQARVAAFPPDVREAHQHSNRHRENLLRSTLCGCFYCCETFSPQAIHEWIDTDESGVGQTALCPKCGIDSVLGDASGFPIERSFLERMNARWF